LRVNERQIDHRATTVLPVAEACAAAGVDRYRGLGGGCLSHEGDDPSEGLLSTFHLRRWTFVPLAGLEPATCCLGDVSAQTLCRSANFLVASERGAKIILWLHPRATVAEALNLTLIPLPAARYPLAGRRPVTAGCAPLGSGAARPSGALRAIDSTACPRSWRTCGPRRRWNYPKLSRSAWVP